MVRLKKKQSEQTVEGNWFSLIDQKTEKLPKSQTALENEEPIWKEFGRKTACSSVTRPQFISLTLAFLRLLWFDPFKHGSDWMCRLPSWLLLSALIESSGVCFIVDLNYLCGQSGKRPTPRCLSSQSSNMSNVCHYS